MEATERGRKEKHLQNVDWTAFLDKRFDLKKVTTQQVHAKIPAWVIDGFLSPAECKRLIQACENSKALGATPYSRQYRGNTRMLTTDKPLATRLWSRLECFTPRFKEWRAVGLNERWRWAKYWPSDQFGRHVDAFFKRSSEEQSFLTVNIYLNGSDPTSAGLPTFAKGYTRFFLGEKNPHVPTHLIKPKPGRVLLFQQPPCAHLRHDGESVAGGNKYLLRSDVMYTRL